MLHVGWKGEAYVRIVAGVYHHFVSKMADVLNWIARSGISVEGGSRECLQKFTPLNILEEMRVMDVSNWDQVLRQLVIHDSFLDQLVEGMEIHGFVALKVAPCLY